MKTLEKNIIKAVAMIIVGTLFCVFGAEVVSWVMTALGVLLVALGVADIIKENVYPAIIKTVAGVVIILGGWLFLKVILIILGALAVVYGISHGVLAIKEKNPSLILSSIVPVVFGVLLIINQYAVMDWLFIVLGILIIIEGILILLESRQA